MLEVKGDSFKGKTVAISGSGNVAQYACEKATELGAKVVTLSDSSGFIYDANGIDTEKLAFVMELKNVRRGRIKEYADKFGCEFHEGRPWGVKCDIALPCATQNELNEEEAKTLVANGCMLVSEGANMPSTPQAIAVFQEAKILFEQFLTNVERSNWNPETQEALFDSIAKLVPNFFVPKLFNNFKDAEERRALVRLAYANRDKVSDLESRIIEANYERRINGTIIRQDQIMDSMIIDFPQYDQLRIWSGDIKNGLDVKAGEKRWEEALEINPNSFEAYVNLAFLHFPTGNNFNMLATDERNLDKAETLLNNAKKILLIYLLT
jgi:cation diffusion facilitator CzcD-associated flavoprotein CzcO